MRRGSTPSRIQGLKGRLSFLLSVALCGNLDLSLDYAFEKLDLASFELKAEVAKRKDANSILFGSMPKTNERGKRHLKSKEEDQSLDQSSVFPKEWERSRAQRGLFRQFHPFQLLSQFFLKKKQARLKGEEDFPFHL